jgi:hypothetical protein
MKFGIKIMVETLSVDAIKIDQAMNEVGKLLIHLNKISKKSRKEENIIKKITNIRDLIQDALLNAKLKKSVSKKGLGYHTRESN